MLALNGSPRGEHGNTAQALRRTGADVIHLATYDGTVAALRQRIKAAPALIIGSGVYWSSWGSPLQRFLEVMTSEEASDTFMGKPLGVILTMDSVGGSDVAARLTGVFTLWGCVIPPFSTVILSRAAQADEDVWHPEDIDILVRNLRGPPYTAWPIKRLRAVEGPYPHSGILDLGSPPLPLTEGTNGQPAPR